MFKPSLRLQRIAAGLPGLALVWGLGAGMPAQAQTAPPASAFETQLTAPVVASAASAPAIGAAASTPAPALPASAIVTPAGDAAPANPYGLRSVWQQGDAVARSTLGLLALMSLLSWYVIVAKALEQRRLSAQALAAKQAFAGTAALAQRSQALPKTSPFRTIADSAAAAARRHASLASQIDMHGWLSQDIVQTVSSLQMRTQEGLSILATVGATAPFVGLFGTVWGIYNALVTIGTSGQASIEKVAGPVGEALIMTALGLAVAVPAVLGYNWLVRRNRVTLHAVRGFGSELHTQLLVEIEQQRAAAPQQAG